MSSSRLTSLQLIQIPPADRHVALILVHAPREALDILRTRTRLLLLLLGSTSITSLRIVETVVHRLRIGVLCRLLVLVLCCWCLWLSRGTATEPAADGMADRRPNCYTAIFPPSANFLNEGGVVSGYLRSCTGHLPKESWTLLCRGWVRLSLAWSSRRHRPLLLCWPSCSWLRSWGSRPRGSAGSPRRGGTATARTRHL